MVQVRSERRSTAERTKVSISRLYCASSPSFRLVSFSRTNPEDRRRRLIKFFFVFLFLNYFHLFMQEPCQLYKEPIFPPV